MYKVYFRNNLIRSFSSIKSAHEWLKTFFPTSRLYEISENKWKLQVQIVFDTWINIDLNDIKVEKE